MVGLNLGNLCELFRQLRPQNIWAPPKSQKESWTKKSGSATQADILTLIYSMVWERTLPGRVNVKHASNIFNHKESAANFVQDQALHCDTSCIQDNFKRHFFDDLSVMDRRKLVQSLQELVMESDLGSDQLNLEWYLGYDYVKDDRTDLLTCQFAANCIRVALVSSNKEGTYKGSEVLRHLPENVEHYDPYSRDYHKANSTALQFRLIEVNGPGQEREAAVYHSHERMLEHILKHGVIITGICCEHGLIRLYCQAGQTQRFTLRRLEEADAERAVAFVDRHLNEFRPKKSWGKPMESGRQRTLTDMVREGLKGKWTAYAYFDEKGEIAAYLDYKMRSNAEIELGVQLTETAYRKKKLATGLVNFYRFKFMNNCLFVSTFEENAAMRKVLKENGFRENYFYDPKSKLAINLVRERINPRDPENEKLWTNSVYYFANKLLHGAVAARKK